MSRRYTHYLTRPSRAVWPASIYCVAAWPNGHVSYCWMQRTNDTWTVLPTAVLYYASEWWQLLTGAAVHGGEHWIISYQCARTWALLGFWEGVEDGTIKLDADKDRPQRQRVPSVHGMRPGYAVQDAATVRPGMPGLSEERSPLIVTEDPPNIARFRLRHWPAIFTWVDCRNYGVDLVACDTEYAVQVYQLALLIRRMRDSSTRLNLGSLRPTVAGQALHSWRRSYMPRGVLAWPDVATLDLESRANYGGRCEAFRLGPINQPVGHYDVRSEYGACMAAEDVPVRLRKHVTGAACEGIIRSDAAEHCIADVLVETDEPAYPLRRDNLVVWPVGRFRTTLAGPELRDALHHHRIMQTTALAIYQCESACSSFARAVYAERLRARENGDHLTDQWLKSMLVCLPGKLAQRNREWELVAEPGPIQPWGEWVGRDERGEPVRYRSIGGVCMKEVVDGFIPDAVPAIAAWITSAGRIFLLRMIRTAGWENTLYVDTDAIMVTADGAVRLRDGGYTIGDGMGELRVVYRGSEVCIYGIKHYTESNVTRCAGVPRGVVRDRGDGRHYYYIPAPADEIKGGRRPASAGHDCVYPGGQNYRHGQIAANGRVTPFRLWED